MDYSPFTVVIAFLSFNAAIFAWVFGTSPDPFIAMLQLTLPLLVWEVLLFATFAPDDLLDLFLPAVADEADHIPVDQTPGPHGDCWSDEPTEYDQAEDSDSEYAVYTNSSDSSIDGLVYRALRG